MVLSETYIRDFPYLQMEGPRMRSHAGCVSLGLLLLCGVPVSQAEVACEPRPVLGRAELKKIKTSLGRINDEVHAILGVLDDFDLETPGIEENIVSALQTISGLQSAWSTDSISRFSRSLAEKWIPTPAEITPVHNTSTSVEKRPFLERWAWLKEWALRAGAKVWQVSQKILWGGLFVLDISVVIGMMLFLESIGKKPRRPRKRPESSAAPVGEAPGTPIPTPTATAGRESSQWLAWLSQEELLAACLKEHCFKFLLGLLLAFAVRLPKRILQQESIILHLLVNISVTLRCVGLALVLMRDSLLSPKAEDVARETANVLAERGAARK